jgi:predicted deacetylase
MLCVSIHDVAPATWSDCLRLVEAVRAVADIPLTWLVVPHYHFRPEQSPAMEACLNVALERDDELALHGYSHLDTEAGGGGLRARFLRNVYTRREGEFAALTEAEARRRLDLGLDWFAARGWTPTGFIPPAWLLGEGAWRALRDAPFAYTTTFSHFHCLPGAEAAPARSTHERGHVSRLASGGQRVWSGESASVQRGNGGSYGNGNGNVQGGRGNYSGQDSSSKQFDRGNWTGPHLPESDSQHDSQHDQQRKLRAPFVQNNPHGTHALLSPSLVYAARNRSGRLLSPRVADATAAMLARAPLVRFSLHPPDARYPELVRHIQQVLERLLAQRDAVTKAECARRLTDYLGNGLTSTGRSSKLTQS